MELLSFFTILNFILLLLFSSYFLYRLTSKRQAEKIIDDVRSQINKLIGQLDQVSDRNLTLIENSIDDLKKTINESKRREKNIKELIESPNSLEKIHDNYSAKKSLLNKKELVKPAKHSYERREIVALAKKGLDSKEIAKVLDISYAEVELVISLEILGKKK